MEKPKYYIQTFYEPREGFYYDQPVKRLNGKSYYEYPEDSYERENWGFIYWDSKKYNDALQFSRFNDSLWKNKKVKIKAFEKIYDFIKNHKSGTGSAITALHNFEIYLMNDGFEMLSFSECNALNPSFVPICKKIIGDELVDLKGFKFTRSYTKDNIIINIAFGLNNTNFYFTLDNNSYQVSNDKKDYKKAIKGKLKKLDCGGRVNIDLSQYYNL